MSNVKEIRIQGYLDTLGLMTAPSLGRSPLTDFAVEELVKGHNIPVEKVPEAVEAAHRVNAFLAASTFPHFGLKIRFLYPYRTEKNGYNGQISYYGYDIEGREAVSFEWFDALVAALQVFGRVNMRACRDIEA